MEHLPTNLYTAEQVRKLDRRAMAAGLGDGVLMARAGESAWRVLRARWPEARRLLVVCGGGNNGGDGYVVARLAHTAGLAVQVLQLTPGDKLRGDAADAWAEAQRLGVPMTPWQGGALPAADTVVDGLLGTGLERDVAGRFAEAVERINAQSAPVLALDLPSGLAADTGAVLGCAVRATSTVTFIGIKRGLLTGSGPDHAGALVYDDLGVPATVFDGLPPAARRVPRPGWRAQLPARTPGQHKGASGHILVVGGELGTGGAVKLAAEGALRTGAGLVSAATRRDHVAGLVGSRPEIMARGVADAGELAPMLARATVIAAGPGLGQEDWGRDLLRACLAGERPLVVDADGLNLLAAEPCRREDWVLTPHPGEAGRLLGCPPATVQADRFAAAEALQQRYGGIVVLKGAGTLIQDGDSAVLCSAGGPALAVGGSGDVLSGVIAGLLAQGMALHDAACHGVCLHAVAGELVGSEGARGVLPSDLFRPLQRLANPPGPSP